MNTENWIAVGAGIVALVAAWVSYTQARHARAQTLAALEQVAIAHRQLEQAEAVHREQNEPYVIVDIQPDGPGSSLLVLLIENIGPTVARDVKITADPPVTSASGDNLTERLQGAMSAAIPMLPPGRRLKYAFDVSSRRFASDLPTAFRFTVEAKGPFGDVEPMEYLVDISSWRGTLRGERPTGKLEDALKSIAGSISDLSEAYGRANASAIRMNDQDALDRLRQELDGGSSGT
ncbi:hypothetical protein ACI3K4_27515 [Streptomyces sp. CSMPJR101]|uniref:hypothetical protein n=1 Tax=Streptomyces sp. CSMPJR101 TaxID=1279378 RepID=UPI0038531522